MSNIIKEEKDPLLGKTLYVVYEANGGMRRFSTREEAETYTPNNTDPSENILNDMMAGGAGLRRALMTGAALTGLNTARYWLPRMSFLAAWGLPGALILIC